MGGGDGGGVLFLRKDYPAPSGAVRGSREVVRQAVCAGLGRDHTLMLTADHRINYKARVDEGFRNH